MPGIRFLLDENIPVRFAQALRLRQPDIDVLLIGDSAAPARGTSDPALLRWIDQNDRVLISLNRRSLPVHLTDHLQAGSHVPGILLITARATWAEVIENVLALSSTIDPNALRDQIRYLPI